jgi:hypothetical protein
MANMDEMTDHMNWEVNVISSDEINAFVLPVSYKKLGVLVAVWLPDHMSLPHTVCNQDLTTVIHIYLKKIHLVCMQEVSASSLT